MSAPAPTNRPSQGGSLYVADLKLTVTESFLFDFFRRVGDISSVRVCRDSSTNVSLGYAYVNFINAKDAAKALESLNYEPIDGRPCRISWSQRDPSVRKSNVGNLFIKNIEKNIDLATFSGVFTNFGEVLSCKLVLDPVTGESRGYGFVHFKNPADAELAIKNLNDKFLNEKQIFVGHFIPKNQRTNSSSGQGTNIFLKHFNPSLNKDRFAELIQAATADCGKITSPYLGVSSHEENGETITESRGFGFANYESHDAAQKAMDRFKDLGKVKELAPELLNPDPDVKLFVAWQEPKNRMQSQRRADGNLYIKNIADTVSEERLRKEFEEFGPITSVKIMTHDETKVSKGFGFVCFEIPAHARLALTAMNNKLIDNKPLYVAIHQPRSIRQQQLAMQYSQPHMPMGMPFGYPNINPRYQLSVQGGRGGYRGGISRVAPYNFPPFGSFEGPKSLPQKLRNVPDHDKLQVCGDHLFTNLLDLEWIAGDTGLARKLTGMILGNVHNKPINETVNYIVELCEENKLNEEVQKLRAMLPLK